MKLFRAALFLTVLGVPSLAARSQEPDSIELVEGLAYLLKTEVIWNALTVGTALHFEAIPATREQQLATFGARPEGEAYVSSSPEIGVKTFRLYRPFGGDVHLQIVFNGTPCVSPAALEQALGSKATREPMAVHVQDGLGKGGHTAFMPGPPTIRMPIKTEDSPGLRATSILNVSTVGRPECLREISAYVVRHVIRR